VKATAWPFALVLLSGCSLLYSKDELTKTEAETQEVIRQNDEILRQLESVRLWCPPRSWTPQAANCSRYSFGVR
jgi:hypothetical protein